MRTVNNLNSINAINQYISYVKSKGGDETRHEVLILKQGENYPVSTYIHITKGEYYTFTVENISGNFVTNSFKSNEYVFEYHTVTNTLIIKISNILCNTTELDITYYK